MLQNNKFPIVEKTFMGTEVTKDDSYEFVVILQEKEIKTSRLVGKPLAPEFKKSTMSTPQLNKLFEADKEKFLSEYVEVKPSACKPETTYPTYAKI